MTERRIHAILSKLDTHLGDILGVPAPTLCADVTTSVNEMRSADELKPLAVASKRHDHRQMTRRLEVERENILLRRSIDQLSRHRQEVLRSRKQLNRALVILSKEAHADAFKCQKCLKITCSPYRPQIAAMRTSALSRLSGQGVQAPGSCCRRACFEKSPSSSAQGTRGHDLGLYACIPPLHTIHASQAVPVLLYNRISRAKACAYSRRPF
ncbi:hypothetical protein OF83DRAFT_1175896 [Amylostereum chailletii]|nr:hypothetical protein OF83DRAFT_1175896 [Amylostereum chailletii]